jgi:hypothetical protein
LHEYINRLSIKYVGGFLPVTSTAVELSKLTVAAAGGGRSGNPDALAGFPSEVGKSRLLGLFHGAASSTTLFTHSFCYRASFV